jgi:predicted adenylyl cyclase CyaB
LFARLFFHKASRASRASPAEADPIPNEIEIKLPMTDAGAARKKVAKLGAQPMRSEIAGRDGRVHEMNVLFDTPDGGFARHGQLLRLRTETPPTKMRQIKIRAILTYKGPAEAQMTGRYKIREETEVIVADADAMRTILEALGLRGWFRYEKFRTTLVLPTSARWAAGLHVELDETPIGTFLELEGLPAAIDRAAQELGFSPASYITKSYFALHIESCRRKGVSVPQIAPGIVTGIPDMLFPKPGGKK